LQQKTTANSSEATCEASDGKAASMPDAACTRKRKKFQKRDIQH